MSLSKETANLNSQESMLAFLDSITGKLILGVAVVDENGDQAGVTGAPLGVTILTALPAGENHIGQIGGEGIRGVQEPVITAGAYLADENVGGMLEFEDFARTSGRGGVLSKMIIIDDASQSGQLELWLFDRTFTAGADNAAWTADEDDLENLVDVIPTTDGQWYAAGATGTVCVVELARKYLPNASSLFGRLVTRTADTYAAVDDLTVILEAVRE